MIRKLQDPTTNKNVWLMHMLGKFGSITKLYIFCPHLLSKKKNVSAPLTGYE